MDRLDLVIFGSSRPNLLIYTYESFQKKVEAMSENVQIRKIFHEDVVYPEQSKESIKIARNKGFYVFQHDPFIGLGPAMEDIFLNLLQGDYIFYLQDDWEFERHIDLDRIIWTMNNHPEINCITFNKYRNMKPTDFEDKEVDFDGMKCCLYNGWQFLPGIWRTSIVKNMFFKHGTRKERPEGYWQNLFGTHQKRLNHEHLKNKVGAYMYGGMGEYRYVRHIGGTWRMAEWQRAKNKNTEVHWDFMNLERDRAPWLPNIGKRPMNRNVKLSKEGMKHYEKQNFWIKEVFKNALPED